jgi:hypothetical protein
MIRVLPARAPQRGSAVFFAPLTIRSQAPRRQANGGIIKLLSVAFAQIGIVGFDGQIEIEALRLHGLPEAAPALLCGTPVLPVGQREFAAEVAWDLPSLAPGATSLLDVTVNGARAGDLAQASLVSSTWFIELDAAVWSNNTVRVMAWNISAATFDLAAATLSVEVAKRRVP